MNAGTREGIRRRSRAGTADSRERRASCFHAGSFSDKKAPDEISLSLSLSRILTLWLVCCASVFGLASCIVNTDVNPIPYDSECDTLYVIENPRVNEDDFLPLMSECASKHGFKVQVVPNRLWDPAPEDYSVIYTARRRLTVLGRQLAYARVIVRKGQRKIASCSYHIPHFSMALDTYYSTETKMTPLFEELFKNYTEESRAKAPAPAKSGPYRRSDGVNKLEEK